MSLSMGAPGARRRIKIATRELDPPVITVQPEGGTAPVTLSVTVTGSEPFTYQWQSSEPGAGVWNDIGGATSSTYEADPVEDTDYRVVVTNAYGSATSDTAAVTLSAGAAFDLATAVLADGVTRYPGSVNTPNGLAWSPGGDYLYHIRGPSSTLVRDEASTPYDITTLGSETTLALGSGTWRNMDLSPDGTRLFVVRDGPAIHSWTLSTPWDITTAVSDGTSYSFTDFSGSPLGFAISPDGLSLLITNNSTTAYEYVFGTAFDITTLSYTGNSLALGVNSSRGLRVSSDGTKLYVNFNADDTIRQYTLPTPWSLVRAFYDGVSFFIGSDIGVPTGLALNEDQDTIYAGGHTGSGGTIFSYAGEAIENATVQDLPAGVTPVIWLDGADDDSFTLAADNGITQWDDKSGNANHFTQSTSTSKPTRVLGGAYFNNPDANSTSPSATHYMQQASSLFSSYPFAAFAVVDTVGQTGTNHGAVFCANQDTGNYAYCAVRGADAFTLQRVGSLESAVHAATWTQGQRNSLYATWNQSLRTMDVNDTESPVSGTTSINAASTNSLFLGIDRIPSGANPAGSLKGLLRELIVLDYIPDATEHGEILSYLNNKWGL